MRPLALATLVAILTALPLAAQPSPALVTRFDAAMNQPPEHNRVTRDGNAIVIRSTNCATTVPVTPSTYIEVLTGGVNPYAVRIFSAGIRIACTSFQDDTEFVNYRFDNAAARDAAVDAARALFAGWSGGSTQPVSTSDPAPSGEIVKTCVSGDCTDGTGTAHYSRDGAVLIRYTGAFQGGTPQGQGRYTDSDGDVYEGTFSGGYEVRGTMTYVDGDVYTGDWQNGQFHGQGRYTFGPGEFEGDVLEGTFAEDSPVRATYTWASGQTYSGEWNDWMRHGQGTMTYTSGNRYEGGWMNGDRHGQGTFTWASGSTFSGQWVEDARVRGREHYANGNVYEGHYADDKRNGQGTMTYTDGSVYTGGWFNDEKHGRGRYTWGEGDFEGDIYDGDYTNGARTGQGTYTWSSGMTYTGAWVDGVRLGQGVMTWPSGQRYEGAWQDGKRHGQGTQRYSDGRLFVGTWTTDQPIEGTLQQVGGEPRPVRVENDTFLYLD